ncbi:MAG: NYN domain-containing protein [Clostridia bacterium]|nr:NYN domain-containing protein [Clostridia bacterium]
MKDDSVYSTGRIEKNTAPGKRSSCKDEPVTAGPSFYKVAIFVDGEFFLKRYCFLTGKDSSEIDPKDVINVLYSMCNMHAARVKREIYRIFFYDCAPFQKKLFNPISMKTVDFAKSDICKFRTKFHNLLKKSRKFALRLGKIADNENERWTFRSGLIMDLIHKKISIDQLTPEDIHPNIRQKMVDMKIGIDIATLSLKHLVDTIILISGDGDFVPAAKLARREGIDFILDPMYKRVQSDLFEHIDGLHSTFNRKNRTPAVTIDQAQENKTE